ncbi:hypothetical protein CWI39_3592p0010 [Hamiltosporidium magnivora]|uniref:Uncharacterized protein n=1 Tax=Hamiltosporidium magnivora TaxID=148818 RepID=A0A4Q9KRN0_9MICR|nr:hypothetical protein CWI39_3592p0010 [Hamiltosporidium magnivora]
MSIKDEDIRDLKNDKKRFETFLFKTKGKIYCKIKGLDFIKKHIVKININEMINKKLNEQKDWKKDINIIEKQRTCNSSLNLYYFKITQIISKILIVPIYNIQK